MEPSESLVAELAKGDINTAQTALDEETFWNSFEPWPAEDAEEIRENIRRFRRECHGTE